MYRTLQRISGLLAAALLMAQLAVAAGPLRALIVSGENDHDWHATLPYVERALRNSGRFEVRVTEAFGGATAKTLANYDVLVLHYHGPRWGAATEKAVEDFVRSGKGLVTIHGASYGFSGFEVKTPMFRPTGIVEKPWPAYRDMMGAYWTDWALKHGHGQRHTFAVKFKDPAHPVAHGMGESFQATDELYHNITFLPSAHVLATAYDDPKFNGTGKDEPILWTVNYGRGRAFHTVLGHDAAAMYEPGFLTSLACGAEWAATGDVKLAEPVGYEPRREANALRVMVVTAGHPYDTAFDSVFEGQPDIAPFHYPRNRAFTGDIRKKWDVVLLYDLTAEPTDQEKAVLKDFVESGKGLIVLHHAIADHQNWPWWYEQVAGGKFFLQAEAAHVASGVKNNQDIIVRPAAKHPITAGMAPMHLIEETYNHMWISPQSTPLLETDAPASDHTVAWISPYPKSRVVAIQLGHDRKVYLHPQYRELLHRAILWAGGRLN
jgi:type 1 glutamine amidotransferase